MSGLFLFASLRGCFRVVQGKRPFSCRQEYTGTAFSGRQIGAGGRRLEDPDGFQARDRSSKLCEAEIAFQGIKVAASDMENLKTQCCEQTLILERGGLEEGLTARNVSFFQTEDVDDSHVMETF